MNRQEVFKKMNSPIGIFDSGIGGLTVVKELFRQVPYENIIYFGDTARVPYGTKSDSTVIRFSLENILFLLRQQVKLIVVACNTSSSIALPQVRSHFRIPIIGVIQPSAKEAVYATKNKRVGVIGTPATIKSHAYEKEIKQLDPKVNVLSFACPLFVPLVEEGWLKEKATFDVAKKYLSPLKKADIDTLILGCTHYPLLKAVIRKIIGKDINLIDSANQVAQEVKQILSTEGLSSSIKKTHPRHIFYVSDEPLSFARLAKRFLGYPLTCVKRIENI